MQLLKQRVVHLREEPPNLIGAGKHPPKTGVGIACVTAELRLRRFLEHNDPRRARLFGRHRRFERRAASAYYCYRDVFNLHGS
jgi:hypothetical protein